MQDKFVIETTRGKAVDIYNKCKDKSDIIIACDTVVASNGKLLGKPKTEENAVKMLKELNGKSHEVYSGVVVYICKTNEIIEFSDKTSVKFCEMSDEMIEEYVNTKEPLDKAGAYGIQGIGGCLIEGINGCYYNVFFNLFLLIGDGISIKSFL